jgi:hypothetical protein
MKESQIAAMEEFIDNVKVLINALHRNYMRRKASGKQKEYEASYAAKEKGENA